MVPPRGKEGFDSCQLVQLPDRSSKKGKPKSINPNTTVEFYIQAIHLLFDEYLAVLEVSRILISFRVPAKHDITDCRHAG